MWRLLDRPSNPIGLNIAGHGSFPLREVAHGQLAEYTGIPKTYYDKMRREKPELLVANADTWLQSMNDQRLVRTLDGDVRALLSNRYRPLDSFDLVAAALPAIRQASAQIVSCEVTERKLYIKATTISMRFEVKRGDIVEMGTHAVQQRSRAGALATAPFLNRLICLSKAVANEYGQRRTHTWASASATAATMTAYRRSGCAVGTREADDKAFFLQTADVVRACLDPVKMEPIAAKLRESTGRTIDGDPVKVVEVTAKRLGMGDAERANVLKHLIAGADISQWGLMNAVTRAAGDAADYDRATELERAGYGVVELDDNGWQTLLKEAN